jgi:hypothetical protein
MSPSAPPKASLLVENTAEAGAACLFFMLQGNFLLLSTSHLAVAAETGLIAGSLSTLALVALKRSRPLLTALVLGVITAIVDYLVHPDTVGAIAFEAGFTGLGAACLSLLLNRVWPHRWRRERH